MLEQIAANAVLNLSMVDQDISYGIFDLKGSGAAVRSLRAACASSGASASTSIEAPEGVVYCGGGAVKRQIEYVILDSPTDQWDVRVTVNGDTRRAMSAYSYFGEFATTERVCRSTAWRRSLRVSGFPRWWPRLAGVWRLFLSPMQLEA